MWQGSLFLAGALLPFFLRVAQQRNMACSSIVSSAGWGSTACTRRGWRWREIWALSQRGGGLRGGVLTLR